MPGMRLFGRRCSLATDDFFFIGLIESIVFLPFLGWIPVVYSYFLKYQGSCEEDPSLLLLNTSLLGLCALFFLNWIIGALFVIFSMKGTISDPEPRRHVVTLVYAKLFVSLLDVAWAILGTDILILYSFCDIYGVAPVVKVCTIFQWVSIIFRVIAIIVFYDWNFSKQNTKDGVTKEYFTDPIRRGTFKKWHFRVQAMFMWCTTPSEARKEAITTLSEFLALLSCDLDFVASDLIAGILIYRQKCHRKFRSEKIDLLQAPPIVSADGEMLDEFPPPFLQPWMNLQLASRYFNLSLGIFGWAWFVYRNVACGCCHLFNRLTCCFPCRKHSSIVFGDNCCGCNLAGLQATTDLQYEDLVHVNFCDKVFDVPFFVTYDHQTKALLITARGTMSMDDVLTDLAATYAAIDEPGLPPGSMCHGGMLNAAREIKNKLETNGILEEAFRKRPDYDLVVTGHSLGASIASILTLLFKHQYPNVRCFAFAPAPTVTKVALPSSFNNIFTVIYGNDSVCCLNYENIKAMVVEMAKYVQECKLPKYKVFMAHDDDDDIITEEKCCNRETGSKNYGTNNISDGEIRENGMHVDVEKTCESPYVTESVYLAGTILHIRRTEEGYRLRISKAEEYRPLSFRPRMILDHFPQYMQATLNQLGKTPAVIASSLARPGKEP
ncbi:sn1-specific diacylglycerol lipase beta [Nephila pilipes]|uniref:sn-1-specific diacylglycerol lipase n=1 Tax=Nephila pilipes TaxID=299642 RepID=A0A8X6NSZ0_NEPPI|nr:sn1-specific diacylglycerol lipase beta [Nephila pilipes]